MIPILYKPDAKTKIGWLAEASDCQCTEERNGVFELEFQYPMLGRYAADLVIDRYVKAKPNASAANQFFHIRKVSKPINGMFTVSCEHISYALSGYPVPTVSASGNAQVAINAILTAAKNQLGKDTGFSVATTDITLSSSIALTNVSARAALGGVSGSVLDVYGGEYEFDNHTIKLHKTRGKDRGVRIAYGRNMTELKCDIDMDSAYTGIYGYVKNDNVDLHSYKAVTNSSGINAKTLIRDFSSDFSGGDSEITQSGLDSAVSAYAAANDINSPTVSMTVSFVDLSQSPEYASFSALESVSLCDTVQIYHKDLNINIKAKVIKTVYDVLRERYTSIELGSPRANFADVIKQTVNETKDLRGQLVLAKSDLTAAYEKAIADATAAITGNSGGYVRLNPSQNPQEILIMDTLDISTAKNIWRFNLSGFGHSSGGYSGSYKTAITQDGHIVADFIDTGTLTANIIKAGIMQSANGEFSFNLETGHIEASDINITGGDINLDGGTLSVLNDDGYKADLSGGVLDLYQGAGTETGTGEKYLTFGSSMLLTTALGGDWYATIAAPEFTLGGSSKGFRFGTSTANASAAMPAVGGLAYNWTTDFAIIEKNRTRIRQCVETNEAKYDQFESLIHHRTVGGTNFKLGVGIAKMNAEKTPGAGLEIRGETSDYLWAGLYAWTELDNVMRLTFQTRNQDGTTYSRTLTANGDNLWFNGRRLKFADEDK
ncbi:MAG: phage tail spike protein [Acutalibacteraceae bacterium]|nr:phage tail spike protein [Acutalibacteraceae bacterium]